MLKYKDLKSLRVPRNSPKATPEELEAIRQAVAELKAALVGK